MKLFKCQSCQQILYFENSVCNLNHGPDGNGVGVDALNWLIFQGETR